MKLVICLVLALSAVDAAGVFKPETGGSGFIDHLNEVWCLYWTNCTEPCGGGNRQCERSNGKWFNIDCHLQDCTEIEDCGSADMVFVLDDSESILERNFWITKQFAIDIIKGLTIGVDNTRIGMVTYSDAAKTHWKLDKYTTEEALEDAIWDLPKNGGNTNTADGLYHAQQIIEQTSRASVKHIVVIITDGESNIGDPIQQAEEMHEQGIEIFAIGIGNINEDELRGIASEKKDEHWHHVPDYTALTYITKTVINETCDAMSPNKTECDEWSAWGPCEVRDGGCGAGNHTRSRECRFYNYEGAEPIRRVDVQYIPCEIPCPSTDKPLHVCLNWTDCDAVCDGVGQRECLRDNGHIWEIPCNGGSCEEIPCGDVDIVFIIDSSISIGEKSFFMAKQFTIDIVKGMPLESHDIHFAAVTFSAEATTEWRLGDYNTKETLEEKLWALPWAAGVTNSQDGLKHARVVFEETGREGVPHMAFFLSDGESNVHPENTIPAAQALHNAGVHVFAIAVRKAGIEELKGIASDPPEKYYLQIDSYEELIDIAKTIKEEACAAARPTTAAP